MSEFMLPSFLNARIHWFFCFHVTFCDNVMLAPIEDALMNSLIVELA